MTRASKLPGRPTLRVFIASGVTVCSVSRRMARASLGSAWRSTCTGGTCHSFTPMSRASHATVQDRRDSENVPRVQMSTHNASTPAGVTPGTVPVPPSFPLSTASETFNTPPLPSLSPRQHHRAGGRASPAPRRRRHCRLGERAGRPRGHDCHHRRCWPRRLAVPPCPTAKIPRFSAVFLSRPGAPSGVALDRWFDLTMTFQGRCADCSVCLMYSFLR